MSTDSTQVPSDSTQHLFERVEPLSASDYGRFAARRCEIKKIRFGKGQKRKTLRSFRRS